MRRRAVSLIFPAGAALFFGWYVRRLELDALDWGPIDYYLLAAGTACGLLFRYAGVLIWLQVLSGMGVATRARAADLAYVYAKAWLGRYLPGKITWILGKIYFAAAEGIPARKLAVSSVFEAALQTALTFVLALLLLSLDPRLDVFSPPLKLAMVAGSCALLALMAPAVFNRVVGFAYARTRKQPLPPEDGIDLPTLLRGGALYTLGFFLSGAGYFFVCRAFQADLSSVHFLFIAGVFNLAGAVGIVAVFAPSGLGVREGVQLLLLPLVMPPETALVVTVAARAWSAAVDLLFFGVTWLHQAVRAGASGRRRLAPSPELP